MDVELPRGSRHSTPPKPFSGCWTCKLRRKKCNGNSPVCDACAALQITCYHDQAKPEWMDGASRQEAMAEWLKCKVKENAHRRRGERSVNISSDRISAAEAPTGEWIVLPQRPSPMNLTTPKCALLKAAAVDPCPGTSTPLIRCEANCTLASKDSRESILIMFYLESVLPFLFPFYQPSLLQGGRSWILEMMISSPVVRQATLCQSSYYFSLARGTADYDGAWEMVLAQTRDAFAVLSQSLHVIDGPGITEHMHGAVRIMVSIMQLQRFEVAVRSFNNCQAHLSAALALFRQLLDSGGTGAVGLACPSSSFDAVISRLGPSSWLLLGQNVQVPSAEQAAFRFSSALLILDDIIASTVLQEPPKLYEYHRSLLSSSDSTEPVINLGASVGCQNWALLRIGEIAALDAWKQRCKKAENLDIIQLVHRATSVKDSLEADLARLETNPVIIPQNNGSLLDVFTADYCQQSQTPASQGSLVTQVWAHAAIVYLFVVVSGWQPVSVDVRYHVGRIVELLTHQISPPALLRTMVWPFCVAGCLAEPAQEPHLRGMVETLQPLSVFGTVHEALGIMENVWRNRDAGTAANRDLAACFRIRGDLVLLV